MGFCHFFTAGLKNQTVIAEFSKIHPSRSFRAFKTELKTDDRIPLNLLQIMYTQKPFALYQIVLLHFSALYKIQWIFRLALTLTSPNRASYLLKKKILEFIYRRIQLNRSF